MFPLTITINATYHFTNLELQNIGYWIKETAFCLDASINTQNILPKIWDMNIYEYMKLYEDDISALKVHESYQIIWNELVFLEFLFI